MSTAPLLAPRAKPRLTRATVESVTQISPNFRRVRLRGDFRAFAAGGLHFRFALGPEGAPLPVEGPDGLEWPGGIEVWHRPVYTIRALDPEATWLDTDVFVHDGGRVTAWTEQVQVGSEIALTGPGGGGTISAPWLGLVGDETAMPVILRILEALPPTTQGRAVIRVPDPADRQTIALPVGMRLDWACDAQIDPVALLSDLSPPAERRFVFFAAEDAQALAARDWMSTRGLTKADSRAASYWKALAG